MNTFDLVPKAGSLYGHVFENRKSGVPLGLYWNIYVPFHDVQIGDEKMRPAVLIDWMTWNIRSWKELNGKGHLDIADLDFIEPSFYTFEHFPMNLIDIEISHKKEDVFKVYVKGLVEEMEGPNGNTWKNWDVDFEAEIKFDGIYMVPVNLGVEKEDLKKISYLLGEFIEIKEFNDPIWESDFRYTYTPRIFEKQ
jgi:hypothetical protein